MKPKPEFWIIDTDTPGIDRGSFTARGPFASTRSVEAWLKADAEACFLEADKSIRDANSDERPWADPVFIVQVVRKVRQVPKAHVTVTLEDVT